MTEALEFEVFSIFPEAVRGFVETGLLGRAITADRVRIHYNDIRDHSVDRHRTVDDTPFGGGAGMVMRAEPVVAAIEAATQARGPMHRILVSPSGTPFDQRAAERLSALERIGLVCGRYEGIDDRVREGWIDECVSLGDFVLNGGEVAALAIIEAVSRLREGVVGNPESIQHESFAVGASLVVEHPHYTRPARFRDRDVPEALLAGDHGAVESWRRRMACLRTWVVRPGLRTPPRLAANHPIIVVGDANQAELLSQATSLAAELGLAVAVHRLGSPMRDLKQVLRQVRRSHGAPAWVLGLTAPSADQPQRDPAMVLDILAFSRRQAPGPLVLWLGSSTEGLVEAWLALGGASDSGGRLAIVRRLTDISQPLTAGIPSLPHVRPALERLRAMIETSP